jgi:hypothetical protein
LGILAGLVVAALAVTAVVLTLGDQPEQTPGPQPPGARLVGTGSPDAREEAPFYPPTPLDGHWVTAPLPPAVARSIEGTRPRQRLTLLIRSTLVLWAGTRAEPNQRIIGHEDVYVEGDRVQLSPVGYSQEKAIYRWRIRGGRLTFTLLERTMGASASERLVSLPFVRSRTS